MLALVATLLGFSLPLDHWSARHGRELPVSRTQQRPMRRRAPLAEHGWEQRVLRNLTRSD
tara:strand:- start:65 stop:244 length:180 start_codon:yes stop_codon:yes gene_type:complete